MSYAFDPKRVDEVWAERDGPGPLMYLVADQEYYNRLLNPIALPPLVNTYVQELRLRDQLATIQFPGESRAARVDAPHPFQMWEWPDGNLVLDPGGDDQLPKRRTIDRYAFALGMSVNDRPFQVQVMDNHQAGQYSAQFDGFLSDRLSLWGSVHASSSSRRNELLAAVSSLRLHKVGASGV